MSLGVPITILVALATSLSAQFYMSWPNYKSEQKERSEQTDESSSKDKSEQTDESSSKDKSAKSDESSSKDKAAKSDETSSAGVSNGKRNPPKRRQD